MNRLSRNPATLAGVAFLLAVFGAVGPATAGEKTFGGIEATRILDQDVLDYANGTSVKFFKSEGVVSTTDPSLPQNGAAVQCAGLIISTKSGPASSGSCAYIDTDGDPYWIEYAGDGTWSYAGGGGKYTGIEGTGTFETLGFANGVLISRFTGIYTLPDD